MIHPRTELVWISESIGRGVRATVPIPRGTLLWVLDRFDTVVEPAELRALSPAERELANRLGYRDHRGRTIVCGDAGRYVNHSCDPVMRGVGPDAMISVRDVSVGDEITCDYAECNLAEPLACECGSASCRRSIKGGDLKTLADSWQADVEAAIAVGAKLEQPVLAYALEPMVLAGILAGRLPCPPLLEVWLPATGPGPQPRVAVTSC